MSGRDPRYMSGLLLRLPRDYQPTTPRLPLSTSLRCALWIVDNGQTREQDSNIAAKRKPRHEHEHIDGRRLNSDAWQALRQRWAQRLPLPCPRCAQPVEPWHPWDLDHIGIPHALATGSDDGVRPAHASCNRKAGAELGQALTEFGIRKAREQLANSNSNIPPGNSDNAFFFPPNSFSGGLRPTEIPPSSGLGHNLPGFIANDPDNEFIDPITPLPTDAIWNNAPWLRQFLDVPDNATWPRLMSPPHPDAIGSYGAIRYRSRR